jgi:TPR repeat protein
MKTKLSSIVAMLLLSFLPSVWADDLSTDVRQLKERAAQGDASAQLQLGGMYFTGQGVPQDYPEALKWYRLAAAQGEASAQYNLGGMYEAGAGVPQDYVQAHKWFNLAGATTADPAQRDLAVKARDSLAARMTPDQIADAQKLAREWKKQESTPTR